MPPKEKSVKTYIFIGIAAYLLIILLSCHIGTAMHEHPSYNVLDGVLEGLNTMTSNPFDIFPLYPEMFNALGIATLLAAVGALGVKISGEKNKHTMSGKENGSAKWCKDYKKYNQKYTDPYGAADKNGKGNMLLSHEVSLGMDTRKTLRNNNILVIGGSGSGKTRFFVKPNVLQANCNYVITDPSGEILESVGDFLHSQGYEIKVFNLVEMSKSHCYNPFNYIRDDEGVLTMIDCLITNTTPPNTHGGDQFWVKSETALLQALCFYLIRYAPKENQNFTTVMQLLRAAEIDENNPNKKSKLDDLFEEVRLKNPNDIALKQYLTFKMGAGKTLKSILISCAVRLTVFNLKQVANLTGVDTLDLASMGKEKKALFVITPQASSTYNFLVSMLYSQLFETLYYVAQTSKEDRLDSHVRFMLDEFVNIGQIPQFTQKLATMRKYEISCSVIIQNIAQIKALYKDDWETIIGNCDTMMFLGGQEYSTLEYISNLLGTQTIVVRNNSRSRGRSSSSSMSYNRTARKLLNPEEISGMNNNNCIVMIRGLDPFYTRKYDYTNHPNYKLTGDANENKKYINKLNNSVAPNKDDIIACADKINDESRRAASMSMSKSAQMISNSMSLETFLKSFDIKNALEVFDKFHLVGSYVTNTDEDTTLNKVKDAVEISINKETEKTSPELINVPLEEEQGTPMEANIEMKSAVTDLPEAVEAIIENIPMAGKEDIFDEYSKAAKGNCEEWIYT